MADFGIDAIFRQLETANDYDHNDVGNHCYSEQMATSSTGTIASMDEMKSMSRDDISLWQTEIRLCSVCGDVAAGFHCGEYVCEACKKFFVRCLKHNCGSKFVCAYENRCEITKESRTQCPRCRYQKCVSLGMYRPGGPNISQDIGHIPCKVCGAPSSGFHFGAITCEGCKGFFRRTVKERDSVKYQCIHGGMCLITWKNRNSCKMCRYRRCLDIGMKPGKSRIGRQPNSIKHATMIEVFHIKVAKGLAIDSTPFSAVSVEVEKNEDQDPFHIDNLELTSRDDQAIYNDQYIKLEPLEPPSSVSSVDDMARAAACADFKYANDALLDSAYHQSTMTRKKLFDSSSTMHQHWTALPQEHSFGRKHGLSLHARTYNECSRPGHVSKSGNSFLDEENMSKVYGLDYRPMLMTAEINAGSKNGFGLTPDLDFDVKTRTHSSNEHHLLTENGFHYQRHHDKLSANTDRLTVKPLQVEKTYMRANQENNDAIHGAETSTLSLVEPPVSSEYDEVISVMSKSFSDLSEILVRPATMHVLTRANTMVELWESMMNSFAHAAGATLRFAKRVPGFRTFPLDDQIDIVQNSMFPIVLVLLSVVYDVNTQMFNWFNFSQEEAKIILENFHPFKGLIPLFHKFGEILAGLNLDETETSFLCGLFLMDTGNKYEYKGLLLDALAESCKRKHGEHSRLRSGRILMCLRHMTEADQVHHTAVELLLTDERYCHLEIPQLYREAFIGIENDEASSSTNENCHETD